MSKRRVLILEFDLFRPRNVGGGQTTYKRIIGHNPDTQYFYPTFVEPPDAVRPANATPIPFREHYQANGHERPATMEDFYAEYLNAWNVARSVREALGTTRFDVVDIPDHSDVGLFMRGALAQHGIDVGAVAISMHGMIEVSLRDQWPVPGKSFRDAAAARLRTHLQFRAADVRYALSSRYAAYWKRQTGFSANLLDPLTITGPMMPVQTPESGEPPTVAFIGRLERCKAPDIFVDTAWCLSEGSAQRIVTFGSENVSPAGVSSNTVLRAMAVRRRINVELAGNRPQEELDALFRGRAIVVLPSRFDTFNLAALEALRLGCPAFVSRQTGISEWIETTYPALSDLVLDFECSRSAAGAIRNAIANYDALRDRVVDVVSKAAREPDYASLDHTYDGPFAFDATARQTIADIQSQFDNQYRPAPRAIAAEAEVAAPPPLPKTAIPLPAAVTFNPNSIMRRVRLLWRGRAPPNELVARVRSSGLFDEAFYRAKNPDVEKAGVDPVRHYLEYGAGELRDPHPLFDTSWYLDENPDVADAGVNPLLHYLDHGAYEGRDPHPDFDSDWYLSAFPEAAAARKNPLVHFVAEIAGADAAKSSKAIAAANGQKSSNSDGIAIGRIAVLRDLARAARKEGAELAAAVHCLRLMRLLGEDRYGDLAFVVGTLNRHNHAAEADVAVAMYGDRTEAARRCRAVLDRQEEAHRTKAVLPWSVLDDRRPDVEPKVSVIISLQDTATHLPMLLDNLAMQSLAKSGGVEIVLIDLNASGNGHRFFQDFVAHREIPAVYGRTDKPASVQAGWNGGIALARAPYIAFLAPNEGLHPDALGILAASLDVRPDIDWATSDTVVTEIDRHGRYVTDSAVFDRTGFRPETGKLDDNYLTWAGGLHRKSVHARFGYFDETFKVAGAAEFKARVRRHIGVLHIPKTLAFLNVFPDQPAVAGLESELEYLRARDLYRTEAAIARDYDARPVEDVMALLRLALGYRKCDRAGLSTDFDLAVAVADYLGTRPDADKTFAGRAAKAAHRMLGLARAIDLLDDETADRRATKLDAILRFGKAMQSLDAFALGLAQKPVYAFVNDARFAPDTQALPVDKGYLFRLRAV